MKQFTATLAYLFSITTLRYLVLAGIPFLAFYIFFPGKLAHLKIQERAAAKKDFLREIWHSVQTTLVFAIIASLILYTPFRQYTQVYTNVNDYPVWYLFVSFGLSMVIHDTYFYWMHRGLHHPKLFKLTHLVHHQSVNPSPWASYSFHILEAIAEAGVLLVIVMIMPMHAISIAMFTVGGFIINVYGHLGYEIAPRWLRNTWIFEITNTSVHHNLHHRKFRGNYGLYFRVWDRVCGTEHPDYVKEYDRVMAQRDAANAFPARPARRAARQPVNSIE
ncbi:sterol desaturase family protein [Chitinophaga parva]|uniref:Sterol desaturase family protein n=1 Tax=Chitinophaga parva TaxID=2169414 RepID=A0A2T7BNW7_9BACT|nr:sterol desaturase family protein [Chitinophaga parva]PUZ29373.1 sterol desaturase family protein [Chitinophaga parva]